MATGFEIGLTSIKKGGEQIFFQQEVTGKGRDDDIDRFRQTYLFDASPDTRHLVSPAIGPGDLLRQADHILRLNQINLLRSQLGC